MPLVASSFKWKMRIRLETLARYSITGTETLKSATQTAIDSLQSKILLLLSG